ncbi:hypothetical protein Tco_0680847 [Tanacetum coccineum]|uniref:Uncharacterized protein n=1 Tax=Tanacetum coccineum TaxID=301880 RepID=A0ABQ4XLP4_9ASTR
MGLKDLHNWYQSLGALDLGSQVLLVYLVNAAKVNSWNVSTYNSTNLVLGWDKDSIKLKKAVFGFIEDVITKTIDYHLFDVVVEFHREIHDLNFRGSSCKNLFVLSSSNRGRLLGFTDLMRQKNKRMKQEGLIQHYGILEDLKSNSSYLLIFVQMDAQNSKGDNCKSATRKEESESVKQKQKDQEDEVFGRILSAKKMKSYYCWFKITAVGEKVNAAKSLLVVSTEVKNRSRLGINTKFGNGDEEINDTTKENVEKTKELGDALQKVLQKHTEELKQQYPQQVNYKDVIKESVKANVINEVKNLLPKYLPKAVSDFATVVIQSTVKKALEKTPTIFAQSSSQAQSSLKAIYSLSEYKLKMILFENMDKSRSYLTHDKHQDLFDALFNSLYLDDGKKTKRRRTKESESSKKTSTTKETSKGNAPTKGSEFEKFVDAEESIAKPTKEVIMDASNDDVVNDAYQPQNDLAPKHNWFTQPPRLPTLDPEWNKFDEFMATPIDFSNFAMNRLKIEKLTKAHLVGPVYNLLKGTCQSSIELEYNMEECYKALSDQLDWNNLEGDRCPFDLRKPLPLKLNSFLKHDVYSHLKIMSRKSVKVNKFHGYGYLEEIMVRRADRQLYKFKEGDFKSYHQKKIQDVQLGVESYQRKLNITKPHKEFPGIFVKELYTPLFDPPGVVYEDFNKQKRVMWDDELYKFSDGTLKLVGDELHHRILNFRLGYNKEMSRRKWSAIDKRRSELMVELIDKKMRERWIIKNLERLVGAQELEMDYMLMQGII